MRIRLVLLAIAAFTLTSCSSGTAGEADTAASKVPAASVDAEGPPSVATSAPSAGVKATPKATPKATAKSTKAGPPKGLTAADVDAGLRSASFPQSASGRLVVVKGDAPAPGGGRVFRVRVEVERGLDVDGQKFAAFVLRTLNDDRSWGHGGSRSFARTDGASDVRVVLASPETSEKLCRPLRTSGTLSCRSGDKVVLTVYRWVKAIPDYGSDRTGYRQYVVNHEIGHALGHGHVPCPGRGKRAPVMMQQTKGLLGCSKNPWPNP